MNQEVTSGSAMGRSWKLITIPVSNGGSNRCALCGNLPGTEACWKAHLKPKPAQLPN